MRERRGRRRVGQVVGRHVDRLHRGDRALLGRRDPLLQRAHVGGQRRLIAHRRGDAAQQRRHFGARLGEAEDVVDEEQHVLAFLVAEVFRQRQPGQADARARTRRLVHLAVHQRHLGAFDAVVLAQLDHAGVDHLVIEVVALARALAHAGEHRHAAMRLGDVVDQLLDDHGLAHAGAAEQPDLAALQVRRQQIHHLDAGDQDFRRGRLFLEARRLAMDRVALLGVLTGPRSSIGSPITFRMRPSVSGPTGTVIGPPVSTTSWPRTMPSVLSMAMQRTVRSPSSCATSSTSVWSCHLGVQRVLDERQFAVELHVHHGAHHLGHASDDIACHMLYCLAYQTASAPEMISISSLVMFAWRARL